jgi:hypothetical protein
MTHDIRNSHTHLHINPLRQEIPQLPPRYAPRVLPGHREQLLPRLPIVMGEREVSVPVERVTADLIKTGLELWRDAFRDVGRAPVKGHAPFAGAGLVRR